MSIQLPLNIRPLFYALFSLILLTLWGCTGRQGAIYDTVAVALQDSQSQIDAIALNPKYRYLRTELNGRPALLVLGYVDETPEGPIESWYSANQELIQIQNGRLVATAGLDFNWSAVRYSENIPLQNALKQIDDVAMPPPVSRDALTGALIQGERIEFDTPIKKSRGIRYQRMHTVMPNYRAQIVEGVELELLTEPPSAISSRDLARLNSPSIRWVQEHITPQARLIDNPGLDPLPAYYALDTNRTPARIVFGRQCLVRDYCLSWQAWPPVGGIVK